MDGALWAMFTGDMNPMHVDETFAAAHGLFGGRFPPGLMAVAIASGLKERTGLFAGTGLAMLEQTVAYRQAVLPDDTIHVRLEVVEATPHPERGRGTVRFRYEIVTDKGVVAIDGDWAMLVAMRASA